MQPDLQPNRGKTWCSLGHAADDLLDFELGGTTLGRSGARWGAKAWTVFKTAARATFLVDGEARLPCTQNQHKRSTHADARRVGLEADASTRRAWDAEAFLGR